MAAEWLAYMDFGSTLYWELNIKLNLHNVGVLFFQVSFDVAKQKYFSNMPHFPCCYYYWRKPCLQIHSCTVCYSTVCIVEWERKRWPELSQCSLFTANSASSSHTSLSALLTYKRTAILQKYWQLEKVESNWKICEEICLCIGQTLFTRL